VCSKDQPGQYERHRPEVTLLFRTVQNHWRDFLSEIKTGGGELPAFVTDEVEAFLRCGIPAHGFVRLRCGDCGHSRIVAFSCKRRGFCPSCLGRRMSDTAAFCVDHIFPRVPVRQYVLTVPYHLRYQMAYAPGLASRILGIFIHSITSDLRRRARKRKIKGKLQTGSLTVVQRFGSSLRLNVHFHTLALDGVYATGPDGQLLFHPLPSPSDTDVARLVGAVGRKINRLLERHDPVANDAQLFLLDGLASASVQGLVATGNRKGCRVLRLGGNDDPFQAMILGKRCAEVNGFNHHANVRLGANDRDGIEQLCRYLARPPISEHRLQELPDGRIALRLKNAWRDNTTHVVFTPIELIEKLIPLIPRPRSHLVRYHGIVGPAAKDRGKIVPGDGMVKAGAEVVKEPNVPREMDPGDIPRFNRMPWAALLKRVFLVDVLACPKCKGRLRILAVVTKPESIQAILDSLGIASQPPCFCPARSPPQGAFIEDSYNYADPPAPEW
jgi:hypothetical protein